MGTRSTGECAMIYNDQKHAAWFQPYFGYKAGKCECSEDKIARGGCRHKRSKARLAGTAIHNANLGDVPAVWMVSSQAVMSIQLISSCGDTHTYTCLEKDVVHGDI